MTKPLRTVRLTISATILEAHRDAAGSAALLHWTDGRGFAIVAARTAWPSEAASGLASVEPGDRVTLTGQISETARTPWLPCETLLMTVETIAAPQQQPQQVAAEQIGKVKP